LRGDLEAWMTGARFRFGIVRPGHRRPLLSHAHTLPAGFDPAAHHQFSQWEAFARTFGLTMSSIDRSPLPIPADAPPRGRAIGLIAGSENSPEKRWPVSHWRALIEACPDHEFKLFGTSKDRLITDQVAAGFGPQRVQNLAGATDLAVYMRELRGCAAIIANDTGGMHLANALGTPVIALFGPTNPVRTGPIYSSPVTILQPPGCPPQGGGRQIDLAPETVKSALSALLG
jgi:ADP-heptose:LPS heptosyltransferase